MCGVYNRVWGLGFRVDGVEFIIGFGEIGFRVDRVGFRAKAL